jgi:hypothetical protein
VQKVREGRRRGTKVSPKRRPAGLIKKLLPGNDARPSIYLSVSVSLCLSVSLSLFHPPAIPPSHRPTVPPSRHSTCVHVRARYESTRLHLGTLINGIRPNGKWTGALIRCIQGPCKRGRTLLDIFYVTRDKSGRANKYIIRSSLAAFYIIFTSLLLLLTISITFGRAVTYP